MNDFVSSSLPPLTRTSARARQQAAAAPGRAGDTGVMFECGEVDNNIYIVDNEGRGWRRSGQIQPPHLDWPRARPDHTSSTCHAPPRSHTVLGVRQLELSTRFHESLHNMCSEGPPG